MPKLTAKTAEKFRLYQEAVQHPDSDIVFLKRIFKKRYGRIPHSLREDFCGTAFISTEWIKNHRENIAVGVDICGSTLQWGRKHNIKALGRNANRVQLLRKNVLDVTAPKIDVVIAMNFSFYVFKERSTLLQYFKAVRKSLRPEGCFVMDMYGGSEAVEEMEEEIDHGNFIFIWDQDRFNPITSETLCYIHFRFKDGSTMKRAFTYDWRVWTIPEVSEVLLEAGFSDVDVYWEGADDDGEGNGVFRRTTKGTADESWIAYVAGWT